MASSPAEVAAKLRRAGVDRPRRRGRRGDHLRPAGNPQHPKTRHHPHRDEHHRGGPQGPAPRHGESQGRRPARLPDQRQPRHGRAPAGHYVRLGRPDQRRPGQRGARRHLRPVGLHRPVRHRGAAEVHRQPVLAVHTVAAAEAMALARRSGLDLELVQKTLENSIASSTIWQQRGPVMAERAWSPAQARCAPCTRSWSRSRTTPPRRACPPGVRRRQGGLRQGPGRRLGRPGHRLRARSGVRRIRPWGAPMTWSLASYTAQAPRASGCCARTAPSSRRRSSSAGRARWNCSRTGPPPRPCCGTSTRPRRR